MTRDTKIGLLLGLVFIFIIAFLINGLPLLRHRGTTPSVKGTPTQPTSPGLAAREQQVRQVAEQWGSPYNTRMTPNPQAPSTGPEIRSRMPLPGTSTVPIGMQTPPVVSTDQPSVGPSPANPSLAPTGPTSPITVTPVASDTRVPRKPLAPLPGDTGQGAVSPSLPVTPLPGATVPSPSVSGEVAPGGPMTTPSENRVVTSEWPKPYEVKEGDSLEAIAKRMYGASEGIKPASITRIFEANKSILKSPDRLSIGQKLTIPAPVGSAAVRTPQSTPVSRPSEAATPSNTQGQRLYTVAPGDSLWKIAAAQLGKGTRYEEIFKLNAATLKNDEDNLEVGMKLRLPAK